ncbi:unannotated protein [freshwater metagenome]|uniref:Unannotated protein n=1 Tax=freshwater metagenome TaxID=449393 RepID=A0A6J7ECZ4_9ZZZZ
MFFTIIWRWVRKVVVVMQMMRMNATILVLIGMKPSLSTSSAPMKVP